VNLESCAFAPSFDPARRARLERLLTYDALTDRIASEMSQSAFQSAAGSEPASRAVCARNSHSMSRPTMTSSTALPATGPNILRTRNSETPPTANCWSM
jgi:mannosyltransferase OCH1-like enzyme